jgi:hypothetical protein
MHQGDHQHGQLQLHLERALAWDLHMQTHKERWVP